MAFDIDKLARRAGVYTTAKPENPAQETEQEQAPVQAPVQEPPAVVQEFPDEPEVQEVPEPMPVPEEPKEQAPVSRPPVPRRVSAPKAPAVTVQIPGFPKSLMAMIRADIPAATNNQDALAAWVYVKSAGRADVDKPIKDLAKSYRGPAEEDILNTLLEKVTRIERASYIAANGVNDQHYLLEWLLLERMAAINSPRIDTIDFTQPAFEQLRAMLRVKLQQVKNMQQARNGRPIR